MWVAITGGPAMEGRRLHSGKIAGCTARGGPWRVVVGFHPPAAARAVPLAIKEGAAREAASQKRTVAKVPTRRKPTRSYVRTARTL